MTRFEKPIKDAEEVAGDAFRQMMAFMRITTPKFTEATRESMRRDAELIARMSCQMDAGQKGRGVPFDLVPHVSSRCMVYCVHLVASGKLDEIEVDE